MKNLIIEPIITEKSIRLGSLNKYIFKVDQKANKNELKKEIAKTFKVRVKDVNIIKQKEKIRRRGQIKARSSNFKKAIVTLVQGEKIKELEIK